MLLLKMLIQATWLWMITTGAHMVQGKAVRKPTLTYTMPHGQNEGTSLSVFLRLLGSFTNSAKVLFEQSPAFIIRYFSPIIQALVKS